jgi:hypothetical protein
MSWIFLFLDFVRSELAEYHAGSQMSPTAATYLICGEVTPLRPPRHHDEDIDMIHEEEIESEEEVPHVKHVLVGEGELEGGNPFTPSFE